MISQDYAQASAFVQTLTGDLDMICDFRAIHDQRQDVPAIPFRGTLANCWQSIVNYNDLGYGIFATVNAMDGNGRELSNVSYIRAHFIDLDNLSAQQNYEQASGFFPTPAFAVGSSFGPLKDGNGKSTTTNGQKYHVYWPVQPYSGNDRFTVVQRKLRQLFNADKSITDATRVMRLPGTIHRKADPQLVTCWALGGYGQSLAIDALEASLAGVNVIDSGGGRHPLGDPNLAAPSLDWLRYALATTDPNQLDRYQWIALMSAVKQAGWTLATEPELRAIWEEWCAQYENNDLGENHKQWTSIRDTELGWKSIVNRNPALKASTLLQQSTTEVVPSPTPSTAPIPMPEPPSLDCSGELLTHMEQQHWFRGCTYVINLGLIMGRDGSFLTAGQFNVVYGGKQFIINSQGKTKDEAWFAATRSTMWTVPQVHHIRFLPAKEYGAIIVDDLGRAGINTYRPINLVRKKGDIGPFLRHIAALLPEPKDQAILLGYLAHNIKYPGYKIPWAPVIQSAEGAGKGILKKLMRHCMGTSYTHFPNAKELADSGAKFNGWMRGKTFILADEIKVDDRRDMIEVLKPMISEEIIEVQGKGADQILEDNFSNWLFFTNYRDAIPVNKNGRRFAIMYSPLQTVDDLEQRQMHNSYFSALYDWLDKDGCAIIADYFMEYPIERGAIPMRAPETSSAGEAIKLSRGPIERLIAEAIEDNLAGFRSGWISVTAVMKRIKETGGRSIQPHTVENILGGMGYHYRGRSIVPYFQEDINNRSTLFALPGVTDITQYGPLQYPG